MRRQVLLCVSVVFLSFAVGQVTYSIPEEMEKGSVVCNVAQDFGLDRSEKVKVWSSEYPHGRQYGVYRVE